MLRLAIAAITLAFASNASADSQVTVEPIFHSSETIAKQPVQFPAGPIDIAASIFTIQPGASLPVHRHPYPRLGYVLSGTITVYNEETKLSQTFKPGDVIVESVAKWHSGTNPGREPLKLLVIDEAPAGAQTTEVRK